MRRLLTLIFALLILVTPGAVAPAQQSAPQQRTQNKEQTVYITRTGRKYHRAGCRYLAHGSVPISLKDAQARGYEPCKVCRPSVRVQ